MEKQNESIKERGFESNEGSIKAPKNMKGKYCLQPFSNVDIHSHYGVRCCSESWMPSWIGDFSKNSIQEIWNMDKIQNIRQSILDGSFSYCDYHQCPFYSNDKHYLYTMEELKNPEKLSPARKTHVMKNSLAVKSIIEKKTILDNPPTNYNLAYDETCNLACPSCRNELKVFNKGPEYEKRKNIQDKLLKEFQSYGSNHVGRFNVSGSGEAFISKVFKDFLYNFNGQQYPNMDINIQSNGVLFTPSVWDKMQKIHGNINEVLISLDAAYPNTYKKIRVNGSLEILLKNLEFLSELRQSGKIRRFMIAYVVQKENYEEMVDAINIGKKLKVDFFVFNLLNDWGSWTKKEYEKNAIWKKYHPDFKKFLEVLENPIFDDPQVDLGNMYQYREMAKQEGVNLI